MQTRRARDNVARTAHLTAWVRALGRLTAGEAANGDYLAEQFLLPSQRRFNRLPRVSRWLLERLAPGAFGYFNARTRYFDEVLHRESLAGLDQLVLLGAGFDSRPWRFARELGGARVFEVDLAQNLSIRSERMAGHPAAAAPAVSVPIDFDRDDLAEALSARGYRASARTLFLWEGVTYYLPASAVQAVLSTIATLSREGSSLVFDYVTQSFFEGDHTSHGAARLADGWRRLGNVHRSGVADASSLLARFGFQLRSELDAVELERRYLSQLPGPVVRAWGPMRIAHAVRVRAS